MNNILFHTMSIIDFSEVVFIVLELPPTSFSKLAYFIFKSFNLNCILLLH